MKSTSSTRKKKSVPGRKKDSSSFPIVAIGASAGGFEAVTSLFQNLSFRTGMAFIYVQHLSPDRPSELVPLLSRTTKMKVQEVKDNVLMKPDNVYVIPFNKGIEVTDGHIKLLPRPQGTNAVFIDVLFSSLAETHKKNIIGIILSGNGTDGAQGLKAIKQAGGITFAQNDSAKFDSMPQSAVGTGAVDFVLSPKEIATELIRISKKDFKPSLRGRNLPAAGRRPGNLKVSERLHNDVTAKHPDFKTIFSILHKKTGVDFSHYKINTIRRRIHRRMHHHKIKTIKEYIKLVANNPKEADLLYKDLLIPVTKFFRDKEIFGYLKNTLLPKLLHSKSEGETLRIWVPACSTGEEAYSIAMLITELQDNKSTQIPVQIFTTDLSAEAIQIARAGEYSKAELKSVNKKLTGRFFSATNGSYRINKQLREMCVFARHNILRDPPFSRMDFVSCRNMLIYFDTVAQKKALVTIHFALNDKGYLLLGKAETVGTSFQLFTPISNKHKIYMRKKNTGIGRLPELIPRFHSDNIGTEKKPSPKIKNEAVKSQGIRQGTSAEGLTRPHGENSPWRTDSATLEKAIDTILLSRYMPACAIINDGMEILQFRGSTELYLRHSSGKASLNILKMARPEFAFELRSAILKAFKTKQPVRKSGIEIKLDSIYQSVSIEACPLKIEWDEPLLLVVFTVQEHTEEKYPPHSKGKKNGSTQKDQRIKKLLEELNTARAEMHTIIESNETSNEELQSANEEIVSNNEELQTMNEELETSKEEIEATNEELTTTNQELQTINAQLTESYNYTETIITNIPVPILVLDKDLRVKTANKAFYKKFLVTEEKTAGVKVYKLGNNQWNIPALRKLLESIIPQKTHFENFEVTHIFPEIGNKIMLLNAHRIVQKEKDELILLAIYDITEPKRLATEPLIKDIRLYEADKFKLENAVRRRTRELQQKNAELVMANKDLTAFNYVASHDLQEPLRKIKTFAGLLLEEEQKKLSGTGKDYLHRMQEIATQMQKLIEDLLIYSRTTTTERKFEKTGLVKIVEEVITDFEETIKEKKAVIKAEGLCEAGIIRFQFRQLIHNLISNSLKFSKPPRPPHIVIKSKIVHGSKLNIKKSAFAKVSADRLSSKPDYCHIIYTDNGIGFDPQYNERIFEIFQRLHIKEEYSGTGIGLAICKRIVENHNGIITATGKLNRGARFDIYIPVG